MDALDPRKWAELVEELFGRTWGRRFNQVVLAFLMLGAIGLGGQLFFDNFIGKIVWPFTTKLFGSPNSGITLDNIESIIIVLVAAVAFFVIVFSLFVLFAVRAFRRRVVPQSVINEIAGHRSEGISILNDRPKDATTDLARWHKSWSDWRDSVSAFLGQHFTQAEQLSFERLGLVAELPWGTLPINGEHAHYLNQLAKQLTILENLIRVHQERH